MRVGLRISRHLLVMRYATLISVGLFIAGSVFVAANSSTFFGHKAYADSINTTDFVTVWKTDNRTAGARTITIPTTGSGYNYDVDWDNDGAFDNIGVAGNISHTYPTAGQYTLRIRGNFPRLDGGYSSSITSQLIDIVQWGNIKWSSMTGAFAYSRLGQYTAGRITATDSPDLTGVTDMSRMFYSNQYLNHPFSFDTSRVTNMTEMFYSASAYDQPISFSVENVTVAHRMLSNVGMSPQSYQSTLTNWAAQVKIPQSISIDADGVKYCSKGFTARKTLLEDHNWKINGDTDTCRPPERVGIGGNRATSPSMPPFVWSGESLYWTEPLQANVFVPNTVPDYNKVTFSIACSAPGANDDMFAITPDNQLATIRTTASKYFRYIEGSENTYKVCVKATDIAGNSSEQVFTITLQRPYDVYINTSRGGEFGASISLAAGEIATQVYISENKMSPFEDVESRVALTCGNEYFELVREDSQYILKTTKSLHYSEGASNTYKACLTLENVHGAQATTEFNLTIHGPKKITGVSFYEDNYRKLMSITGESFMAGDYEMYRLYFGTMIKLNGKQVPFCAGPAGSTAIEFTEMIKPDMPAIEADVAMLHPGALEGRLPLEKIASDTPLCYLYYDTTTETDHLANNSMTVWLPDDFDITAEGTVSVTGSEPYTFNKKSYATTATVNGNKPIAEKPVIPQKPTFSGTAKPGSRVTVTVHSDPVVCETTTRANGTWSCTLDQNLPPGDHTVYVRVVNSDSSTDQLGPYAVTVLPDGSVPPLTSDTPISDKLPGVPDTGSLRRSDWLLITAVTSLTTISGLAAVIYVIRLQKNRRKQYHPRGEYRP